MGSEGAKAEADKAVLSVETRLRILELLKEPPLYVNAFWVL